MCSHHSQGLSHAILDVQSGAPKELSWGDSLILWDPTVRCRNGLDGSMDSFTEPSPGKQLTVSPGDLTLEALGGIW